MAALELNIVLLCFVTALCVYAFVAKAKPDWDPEKILSKKKTYAVAAATLIAAAILVRVWKFGAVPSGMNQDGAMAAVDALALAQHGTDRLGTRLPVYFEAWGYGQMSVLLSYLMVPFIKLFGLSSVTARLPMLLASLAGVWVLFRFTTRVFGRAAGLLALFVVAINPWHIMQSRWALDCNLLPHFLLFSLNFLHLGLKKRAYLYLSMVFFGLTMYTYGIAFISIPVLLAALCAWLLAKKTIKPAKAALCAGVWLFFSWPILAVVAINTFKLPTWDTGLITMQYFPHSIRTNDLIFYSKDFLDQLLRNAGSLTDMALLQKGDFSWNYVRNYGQMYLYMLPFVALGAWRLARRGKQATEAETVDAQEPAAGAAGRTMLLAWCAVAILSGLIVNSVNTNRINIIFYPMCVLAALGLWHAVLHAARVRRVAVSLAAVCVLSFAGFTSAYFGDHARMMARDFCSGFTDAVKYADGLGSKKLYITCWSRDDSAYSCSEIYTLFGCSIDAEYFRGEAEAFGKDGAPLLPYAQRYRYVDFDAFQFDQPIGTAYVYNAEEAYAFEGGGFETRQFGLYGVAVKTEDAGPAPEEEGVDEAAVV